MLPDLGIGFWECAVVGFDLDLTLIDTRDAFRVALRSVEATHGLGLPEDIILGRIGLPLGEMFTPWLTDTEAPEVVAALRRSFLEEGMTHLRPMPGATRLLQLLRERDVRVIIVTARSTEVASAFLERCVLHSDAIEGGYTGEEKAAPLRAHQAEIYVGDHPLDMAGARAAQVRAIGVASGAHTAADLRAAGADAVVFSLDELVQAHSEPD